VSQVCDRAGGERETSPCPTPLHDTMIFWKQNVRMQFQKRLSAKDLAPRARFELATLRLTAECSTVELPGNCAKYVFDSNTLTVATPIKSLRPVCIQDRDFSLLAAQSAESDMRIVRTCPSPFRNKPERIRLVAEYSHVGGDAAMCAM
jgi:hypothetical protein